MSVLRNRLHTHIEISGESHQRVFPLQITCLHFQMYTNRSENLICLYSAILYLNDDFEGGDFIFTELDAKVVTVLIQFRFQQRFAFWMYLLFICHPVFDFSRQWCVRSVAVWLDLERERKTRMG